MIPAGIRRLLLVAVAFLAVFWWQEQRIREARAATVGEIVAELERWHASDDLSARDELQPELETRVQTLRTSADLDALVRALPPGTLASFAGVQALEQWREIDRPAALAWLAAQPEPPPDAVALVARGWTAHDPEGPLRYGAALPAGTWRETFLATAGADAIADRHPQAALALAAAMAPSARQTALRVRAISTWGRVAPDAALAWADQHDPAGLRSEVAAGYASEDPVAAARWVQDHPAWAPDRPAGLRAVAETWGHRHDPIDAARWIATLPDGTPRDAALAGLVRTWRDLDAAALATWTKSLPDGPLRQRAEILAAEPGDAP